MADGTFTDVALLAGVAYNENGKTVAGMGTDFRDIDNDGKPDIFHAAMYGDTFPLYRNLGNGQFEDVTDKTGLAAMTTRFTAWGTGLFDFDNDGNKDIFAAGSAILDNSMEVNHKPYPLPNLLYRNFGNMAFKDESAQAGASFSVPAAHRGAAFGDLDNDGKVDIVVTVLNASARVTHESVFESQSLDHTEARWRGRQSRWIGNQGKDNDRKWRSVQSGHDSRRLQFVQRQTRVLRIGERARCGSN